jgi:rhodanese-related sulfurtransferase
MTKDAGSRVRLLLAFLLVMSCRETPSSDWPVVKKWVRSEFPGVEHVTTEELKERLETPDGVQPLLLDVRGEEEYAVSHLPGALRVEPGGDLLPELARLDRSTPIVAYCSVGYRSSQLVERLEEEGFTDVRNLEGSIFEWANNGYPLEREGRAVKEVHPYDEEWGRLLDQALRSYRPR